MNKISLMVNGELHEALVEPRTSLADFLREHLNLTGTHIGCEAGICGACTVHIDGLPARSCIAPAITCEGADIRTIEAYQSDAGMDVLREEFSKEHALQCGYCTPGMLMSAWHIVEKFPGLDEAGVRRELAGNLCRCTGYQGIVKAVTNVCAKKR
jgi:aerobic carbon-monoxide dehydrogenase small subunit